MPSSSRVKFIVASVLAGLISAGVGLFGAVVLCQFGIPEAVGLLGGIAIAAYVARSIFREVRMMVDG